MRVLVACEYSGVVRDAFIAEGHDAISCDLLPTESPGPHIQGDVLPLLREPWDLVIAHPPCQYLTNAGVWTKQGGRNHERMIETRKAANFFLDCLNANAPRVAVENPTMFYQSIRMVRRPPDCVVQPWMFGDNFSKRTCFWTVGLPPLLALGQSVDAVPWVGGGDPRMRHKGIAYNAKDRALFWPNMAAAMAKQWGCF